MPKKAIIRIETRVLGLQYRLKQSSRAMLVDYLPFKVSIKREPENEADPNAIMVFIDDIRMEPWNDRLLGYIPREVAKEIAVRIDSGEVISRSATITDLDVSEGTADVTLRFRKSFLRRIS